MPLVTTQLVTPSVNVDQLRGGPVGAIQFRTILDPLDLIDPTKSMRIFHEVAMDMPGHPDSEHVWSIESEGVWLGCPLRPGHDSNPTLNTWGAVLSGKRLRTTVVILGPPVTLTGVHEAISVAQAQALS